MHGNTSGVDGRCSGRPVTAAAERLDEGVYERLSGGAWRRPLQPRGIAFASAGFRAHIHLSTPHWHRNENPSVH
jgi:hypothetical protein